MKDYIRVVLQRWKGYYKEYELDNPKNQKDGFPYGFGCNP